jgi:8-oxo-dGTP diphosphatase
MRGEQSPKSLTPPRTTRQAAQVKPLPVDEGLYYRTHHKDAPFGREHASTQNIGDPPSPDMAKYWEPKPGYSAFWSPHHLHQYHAEMGWDSPEEMKGRRVLAFRGTPIGEGADGEPRVMPHSDKPEASMSWGHFRKRLEVTPEEPTRWDDHTWGQGPHGQMVDDGYRTLGGREAVRWSPTSGIFGPTTGLDPLLFDEGGELRPQVRHDLMTRLDQCLRVDSGPAGSDWQEWLHVYLTGGSASEWAGSRPNNAAQDLDVIVAIDLAEAQGYSSFEGMSAGEAASALNAAFWKHFNAEGWHPEFGGTWNLTAFCNQRAVDITAIHPYAAYDVTGMKWAVKPPHLPEHSLGDFSPALVAEARAVAAQARAILRLDEPMRTREARSLWEKVHADRSRAFSDQGEGWQDAPNVIEKWLAYAPHGLLGKIRDLAMAKTAEFNPWTDGDRNQPEMIPLEELHGVASMNHPGHTIGDVWKNFHPEDEASRWHGDEDKSEEGSAQAGLRDYAERHGTIPGSLTTCKHGRVLEDGEHRYMAARDAGLKAVPVVRARSCLMPELHSGHQPKTAAWHPDTSGSDHSGVYLRFGAWPHDERSFSGAGGYHEDGVSAYDLDREGDPSIDWEGENGNDPQEEMQGRARKAERNRRYGEDKPSETGHLVRGEMSGTGYDGEPLLKNVKRVGDWIDHRHLFLDQAGPHRLARDPSDEDYEEPEEKPPYGYRNRTAAAQDPDRFVTCGQGHEHWGALGAAGLLVRHRDGDSGPYRYLLQKRSPHVQHGGTWSTPGGALQHGESPEAGALREASEEGMHLPPDLRHHHTFTDDHGDWAYHTVVMDSPRRFDPEGSGESDWESEGHRWVTPQEAQGLKLHPGFASSWDKVRKSGAVQKRAAYDPDSRTVRRTAELGWGDDEWASARREPWHAAAKLAQAQVRLDHPKLGMPFPRSHEGGDEMVGHILKHVGYQGDTDGAFVSRHPDPSRRTSNPAWLGGKPGVTLHPDRWDYGTVTHEAAHHAVMYDHAVRPNDEEPDEQVHGPEWAGHYAQGLNRLSRGAGDDFLEHHQFYRDLIHEGLQWKRPSDMDEADRRWRESGESYPHGPRPQRSHYGAASALPQPPQMPPRQQEAHDEPDFMEYRRKALDVARNPEPGTVIWRSEQRSVGEDPHPQSVGIHWTVKPEQVIHQGDQDGRHTVVYQGRLHDPDSQAIPRSHPMWGGRHRSMDAEAEVRLRPGASVHVEGTWVPARPSHTPKPGGEPWEAEHRGNLNPLHPERMEPGNWEWHPVGHEVPVRHAGHGAADYADVGIEREAAAAEQSWYHGTAGQYHPGDQIEHHYWKKYPDRADFRENSPLYATTDPSLAGHMAELRGGSAGHLYQVHPTGPVKPDEIANGIVRGDASWETRHPLHVVREVPRHEWPGDLNSWQMSQDEVHQRREASAPGGAPQRPKRTPGSAMVYLDVPHGTVEPYEGQEVGHHVALAYLPRSIGDEDFERVKQRAREAAARHAPMKATVGGGEVFPPGTPSDRRRVAVVPVHAPGIHELHGEFSEFDRAHYETYTPHVTRAQLGGHQDDPPPHPEASFPVTHLHVRRGEEVHSFPLTGGSQTRRLSTASIPTGYRHVRPRPDKNGFIWPMRENIATGEIERNPDKEPYCTDCSDAVGKTVRHMPEQMHRAFEHEAAADETERLTLYRGEGSHEQRSYYPKTGPDALAGAWWTSDLDKARGYAASAKGSVYQVQVHPHEAKPSGGSGNYLISDPEVRARRTLLEERQQKTAVSGYDGLTGRSGMIYLDLPPGTVRLVPGGVDDHHITLCYLGKDVSDKAFEEACRRTKAAAAKLAPMDGVLRGIDVFPPSKGSDGKVVAFVPAYVGSVGLLRRELEDLSASEHTDWRPHVTLAYLEEGDSLPAPHPAVPLHFDRVYVKRGDDVVSFPLTGPGGASG